MKSEHPLRGVEPARRMNTDQAAEYLGLSPSTLTKMRLYGTGPQFLKLTARRVAYDSRALDEFLKSRARVSTSDPGDASAAT